MVDMPPTLTPEIIRSLLNQKNPETGRQYTLADIAKLFGVTRQRAHQVARDESPVDLRTPRQIVADQFPWEIGHEFGQSSIARRVHDHALYVATGGKGMTRRQLVALLNFYKKLRDNNVVVEFHPDIPPEPGNQFGGFAFRPRTEDDGDLIIRVNEVTNLSPEAEDDWTFPPQDPDVKTRSPFRS
jgi:hypothetical protein